jgi:hypothetical protein
MSDTINPSMSTAGCFVGVDIVAFQQHPAKTQQKLLDALRVVLDESIDHTRLRELANKLQWHGRGDGYLIIFPSETPKELLFGALRPDVERLLGLHNHDSDGLKFQIRLIIAFGDYSASAAGFTGSDACDACVVLDSEIFSQQVRQRDYEHPVTVMVSDEYYEKVVCQWIPDQKSAFKRFDIDMRRRLVAWLWQPALLREHQDGNGRGDVVGLSFNDLQKLASDSAKSPQEQIKHLHEALRTVLQQRDDYKSERDHYKSDLERAAHKVVYLNELVDKLLKLP